MLRNRLSFRAHQEGLLSQSVADYEDSSIYFVTNRSLIYVCNKQTKIPHELRMFSRNYAHIIFGQHGQISYGSSNRLAKYRFPTVSVSMNADSPARILCNSDTDIKMIGLLVHYEELSTIYGLNHDILSKFNPGNLENSDSLNFDIRLILSGKCWSILDEIYRCDYIEPLRTIFMRAKGFELTCAVAAQLGAVHAARPTLGSIGRREQDLELIKAAARIYREEIGTEQSTRDVAHRVGLNRNKLNRGFQIHYGMGPGEYARKARLIWAQTQLRTGQLSVKEVAAMTGYKNVSAFSRAYIEHFGTPPSFEIPNDMGDIG